MDRKFTYVHPSGSKLTIRPACTLRLFKIALVGLDEEKGNKKQKEEILKVDIEIKKDKNKKKEKKEKDDEEEEKKKKEEDKKKKEDKDKKKKEEKEYEDIKILNRGFFHVTLKAKW